MLPLCLLESSIIPEELDESVHAPPFLSSLGAFRRGA